MTAEAGVTRDDLRAAVNSGVLDEAQALKLQALSDQRMGYRAHMTGDDEPFELFKGFAEIFVTVGIGLLMSGLLGLSALLGDPALLPIISMGLSVVLALYFTRKRRMTLPSIALCLSFALSTASLLGVLLYEPGLTAPPQVTLYVGVIGMLAMIGYYWFFRLPFTMFMIGLFGLSAIMGLTDTVVSTPTDPLTSFRDFIDLSSNSHFAIGTLIFGLLAFVAAIRFDMKDPHRISRYASAAFWLHILAAPALVNTLVLANYQNGGAIATALALAVLALFTLLAIVIDRRSFLTAGLVYMGLLLARAIEGTGTDWAPVFTLLVLGVFVTTLGAFWTQMRAHIMGALPDFKGKDRLPPYAEGLAVSE